MMAGSNNELSLANEFMLSSEEELRCFDQSIAEKEIEKIIMKYYSIMMEQLQYMQQNLPALIDELKAIREEVDNRHKKCNKATVTGSVTSLAGGFLCIFGILATPFTFGISLGFTVAGRVLITAGSVTTTAAKTTDFALGKWDQRKADKKVKEFLSHYETAKGAYEKILQLNQKLKAISTQPDDGARNAITMKEILNEIKAVAEYAVAAGRVAGIGVTVRTSAYTVHQAIVSPKQLHADTKLALSPHRMFTYGLRFCKGIFSNRIPAISTIQAGISAWQAAGGVLTGLGVLFDVYTLCSTGRKLYYDTKCEVSKKISSDIEQLEDLSHHLDDLQKQLTVDTNAESITNGHS